MMMIGGAARGIWHAMIGRGPVYVVRGGAADGSDELVYDGRRMAEGKIYEVVMNGRRRLITREGAAVSMHGWADDDDDDAA